LIDKKIPGKSGDFFMRKFFNFYTSAGSILDKDGA